MPARSLALVAGFLACGSSDAPEKATATRADLVGTWRVALDAPGGELPFTIDIFPADKPGPGGAPAVIRNGAEAAPITEVSLSGNRVNLRIDHLDAALTADLDASRTRLSGTWQVLTKSGPSTLPLHAHKGQTHRFADNRHKRTDAAEQVPSVAGSWKVEFDGVSDFFGIAEFKQQGDRVTGTVIYPEGTFRYLDGQYRDGQLRLSTFNGAFAVLIRGRTRDDGSIAGEIYLNDNGFFMFQARPAVDADPVATLPDPWQVVQVTSSDRRVQFRFPDLDGKMVSLDDARFEGKVVIVELFGSWCSNCNDAAPHLSEWFKRYRKRGFEVIGLAYEHTGDVERDRRQVRAYGKHYEVAYPLLIAGTSDLANPLPGLSMVPAFPTLLFIDRDGIVRKTYNGFLGPSAERHYERQIASLQATIEELLDE